MRFPIPPLLLVGMVGAALSAQGPATMAETPTPALGPGSVAEFDVQRLVSLHAKPGPSEKWQQIHERRTVLSRVGQLLEVRVEEDFGPGTQPSVRTERIPATAELPIPPQPQADTSTGGIERAPDPGGMPRRTWAGREAITTPAGTFDCIRVAVEIVQISSGTHIDEWYAAGLPWPVRSASVTGAGAVHFEKSELVKLERR